MSSKFTIRSLVTLDIAVMNEVVGRNEYNWFRNEYEARMWQQ